MIAGGGTAGHVVPALALADVLSQKGYEVVFAGTNKGMEKVLVPRAGYAFFPLRVRGFERKLGPGLLATLASLPVAALDAARLLRRLRPRAVVGVGAYASGPVVAEAACCRIPTVVVEMDSHMGWTNRLLSLVVDKVCLSFPDPERRGDKYVYTGRPVRPALLAATRKEGLVRFGLDPNRPVLLVVGGSLGARSLNQAVLKAFAHSATTFQVVHVTGQRDYPWVAQALAAPGANPAYQAHPFLDDLPLALAAADAVISRAGGSVAEILVKGIPALLVPYPYATGDHQTKNAKMLVEAGAALMVPDAELDPDSLTEAVRVLLDPEVNRRMREAALRLARPDAALRVCEVILELMGRSAKDGND